MISNIFEVSTLIFFCVGCDVTLFRRSSSAVTSWAGTFTAPPLRLADKVALATAS